MTIRARSSAVVSDVRGHQALFEDFIRAIEQNTTPICDGREGRRSIALVEAIYRAARNCGAAVCCRSDKLLNLPATQPARAIAQYFSFPCRALWIFGMHPIGRNSPGHMQEHSGGVFVGRNRGAKSNVS